MKLKLKLIHPLWTHLPALLLIAIAVVFTLMALPLPDSAPTHFDISGKPDAYGSPWTSSLLLLGLSFGFLILSAWLDELWTRQEKKKTFNWISLFDELAIGDMCGIQIAYVNMLRLSGPIFSFPWIEIALACGLATGLAVLLELVRPYRHYEKVYAATDISRIQEKIARIIESGKPLDYKESQNPAYAGVLAIVVPAGMFVAAALTWQVLPWLSIILILIGFGLITTYGGFRISVTRDLVAVKMGILGINLLQLKTAEITAVELHDFSPLHDFGGYGIRFNGGMQAYFLKGDRGVLLSAAGGKKYLLGSDDPEQLAAVIDAARA
ncbi:MAG: DUF1648 domain-containing protein [Chloroflexi bacterium]|nr:DUF1648 domain-containing protein [Chloroflexota bacterium]